MSTGDCKWFLLFCDEDKSYSLVPSKDVVCEDTVKRGDSVSFFYNSGRHYIGKVDSFGDDYDSLKKKQNKLNTSNKSKKGSFHAEKPRKASIKSRQAMKDLLSSHKKIDSSSESSSNKQCAKRKSGSKSSNSAKTAKEVRDDSSDDEVSLKTLQKIQQANTPSSALEDDTDHNEGIRKEGGSKRKSKIYSSSSSSNSSSDGDPLKMDMAACVSSDDAFSDVELTPQELKILEKANKKIQLKKRNEDESALQKLMSGSFNVAAHKKRRDDSESSSFTSKNESVSLTNFDTVGGDEQSCHESGGERRKLKGGCPSPLPWDSPADTKCVTKSKATANGNHSYSSSSSVDNHSSNSGSSSAWGSTKRRPRFAKDKNALVRNEMFSGDMFRFDSSDKNVEELMQNSGVYVNSTEFDKIKTDCKSATTLARSLLAGIFTFKALASCSLQGELYTGRGQEAFTKKSGLDEHAVNVIIDYSMKRAKQKGWSPEKSKSEIKHSMRCKLAEARKAYSKLNPSDEM